jgi:hypothetical protein
VAQNKSSPGEAPQQARNNADCLSLRSTAAQTLCCNKVFKPAKASTMFARIPKAARPTQFRMECLESRQLMARDSGLGGGDFPEPQDPPERTPVDPTEAVSRYRPETRNFFDLGPNFAPEGGNSGVTGAGNVKTQFSNGTLILSEDPNQLGSDQQIVLSVVNGKLRVASADGQTLIDGQVFKDFDLVTHLSINFGGGSDFVRITGASLASLNIDLRDPDTGANNDVVQIEGVIVSGAAVIRTGVGNDEVQIANSNFVGDGAGGELGIYTSEESAPGDGDHDSVTLLGVRTASSVKISTGAGDDKILVFQSEIGDGFGGDRLLIKAGAGADAIDIGYFRDGNGLPVLGPTTSVKGYLDIWADDLNEGDRDVVRMENLTATDNLMALLGGGDDTLIMNSVYSKSLDLEMGDGMDNAHLMDVIAGDSLDVYMGEGDDILEVLGMSAASARLDGGAGANDRLVRLYDNFVGSSSQTGLESINGVPQTPFHPFDPDWEYGFGELQPVVP